MDELATFQGARPKIADDLLIPTTSAQAQRVARPEHPLTKEPRHALNRNTNDDFAHPIAIICQWAPPRPLQRALRLRRRIQLGTACHVVEGAERGPSTVTAAWPVRQLQTARYARLDVWVVEPSAVSASHPAHWGTSRGGVDVSDSRLHGVRRTARSCARTMTIGGDIEEMKEMTDGALVNPNRWSTGQAMQEEESRDEDGHPQASAKGVGLKTEHERVRWVGRATERMSKIRAIEPTHIEPSHESPPLHP
ncbi:hypothetical protein BJ912DRAFT_1148047 [Pholiota molesta]|nr:hypothetical protein BJ912DRAFT_1148047 [Pholiota molesta]